MPSPTFTLVQTYELPRFALVHADLYRLSGSAELAELGFDDLPEGTVVLLEWPDRAAGFLPPDRLDIAFTLAPQLGADVRNVRVVGYGRFAQRAERIGQVRTFLDEWGFGDAQRRRMQGDASTRTFERLTLDDQRTILMNAPRRADGPPVRDGKPYSAIAHLAEDILPYVAVAAGLRDRGLSAPTILHADLAHGFVIMEDLGEDPIVARRSAGADRGALPGRRRSSWRRCTASRCRRCCTWRPPRLSPAALRHGGVPDRGRAVARLVPAERQASP